MSGIDPDHFVSTVEPLLARQDLEGLCRTLKRHWTEDQIVGLLSCEHNDARKVAALALGLVGCRNCLPPLVRQLRDPDPMVNQMAEHAMWSIWFRSGCCDANHELARGSQALNQRDCERALHHFDRAVRLAPDFAEAYNQRAIAAYLLERYEDCIRDCRKAVELMPCHFGAWAGLGHCYAHLNQPCKAIECYRTALELNPHLECVGQAVCELNKRIGKS